MFIIWMIKGLDKIYETTGPGRETTGQELFLQTMQRDKNFFWVTLQRDNNFFWPTLQRDNNFFLTDSTTGQ